MRADLHAIYQDSVGRVQISDLQHKTEDRDSPRKRGLCGGPSSKEQRLEGRHLDGGGRGRDGLTIHFASPG